MGLLLRACTYDCAEGASLDHRLITAAGIHLGEMPFGIPLTREDEGFARIDVTDRSLGLPSPFYELGGGETCWGFLSAIVVGATD